MSDPIRYGDVVYIKFVQKDLVVSGNGFYSSQIWAGSSKDLSLKSFRSCLFQILPRVVTAEDPFTNVYEEQFNALTKENAEANSSHRVIELELKNQREMESRAKTTIQQFNDKEIKEITGTPLNYTSKFLLKHVDSGYYLDFLPKTDPDHPKLTFVKLSHDLAIDDYLMFQPSNLYDPDAVDRTDIVTYSTAFYLFNPTRKIALAFNDAPSQLHPLKIANSAYLNGYNQQLPPIPTYRQPPQVENNATYLVGGGEMYSQFLTKFESYSQGTVTQASVKALKSGDYIRLHCKSCYLTVRGPSVKKHPIFIQKANDDLSTTVNRAFQVFQVVSFGQPESEDLAVEKQVLNASLSKDEEESSSSKWMLRHLVSGLILVADEKGEFSLKRMEDIKNNQTDFIWVDFCAVGSDFGAPINETSEFVLRFSNSEYNSVYLDLGDRLPYEEQTFESKLYLGNLDPTAILHPKLPKPTEWEAKIALDYKNIEYLPNIVLLNEEEIHFLLEAQNLLHQFVDFLNFLETVQEDKAVSPHPRGLGGLGGAFKGSSIFESMRFGQQMFQTTLRKFDLRKELIHYVTKLDKDINQFLEFFQERSSEISRDYEMKLSLVRPLYELRVLDVGAVLSFVFIGNDELFTLLLKGLPETVAEDENISALSATFLETLNRFIMKIIQSTNKTRHILSQYIGVFLHSLTLKNEGVFKLLGEDPLKDSLKEIIGKTIKSMIHEDHIEAMTQIQLYFDGIVEQVLIDPHYNSFLLEILRDIFKTAPDSSTLREKFIDIIINQNNLNHIFPKFVVYEELIWVRFERLTSPNFSRLIRNIDLFEKSSEEEDLKSTRGLSIKDLNSYFLSALRLANTIALFNNNIVYTHLINHYPIEILSELTNERAACSTEIKNQLIGIVYGVHMKFFELKTDSLPATIRIVNKDDRIMNEVALIEQAFLESINTLLPDYEWNILEMNGLADQVRITREKYKEWKIKQSEKIEPLDLSQHPNAFEMAQRINTLLLAGKRVTTDKTFVSDLFREYQALLSFIEGHDSESEALEALEKGLKYFRGVQLKRIQYAADRIITRIVEKTLPSLNAGVSQNPLDSVISLKIQDNVNEDQPLLEDEAEKGFLKNFLSDPTLVFDKLLLAEEESLEAERVEDPRWIEIKKQNPFLHQIRDRSNDFGSRKILESHLQILAQRNSGLSRLVIKNLREFVKYEEQLLCELRETEFVTDIQQIQKIRVLCKVAADMYQMIRVVDNFKLTGPQAPKGTEIKIERFGDVSLIRDYQKILQQIERNLDTLFLMIYDANVHFKYEKESSENEKKLLAALNLAKKTESQPFQIDKAAIRKEVQKLFAILRIHEIIIEMALSVSQKIEVHRAFTNDMLILIRKSFVLLSIFAVGDNLNQSALVKNPTLEKLFKSSGSKLHTETIDGLILAAHLVVDNRSTSIFENQALKDIMTNVFIKEIAHVEEINFVTATWLDYACIVAFPGISQLHLSSDSYSLDLGHSVKRYFTRLITFLTGNTKEQLNLLELYRKEKVKGEFGRSTVVSLAPAYFCATEFLKIWMYSIPMLQERKQNFELLFRDVKFTNWVAILQSKNLLFQFELKKLLCQTFCKIYGYLALKQNGIQDIVNLRDIVFVLLEDMRQYLQYTALQHRRKIDIKDFDGEGVDLKKFGRFRTDPVMESIRRVWEEFYDEKLYNVSLFLRLEAVPLDKLWKEYIYDGCLPLLEKLMLEESELMTRDLKDTEGPKNLMEHYLIFMNALLVSVNKSEHVKTYERIEKRLELAKTKPAYKPYQNDIDPIIDLADKCYRTVEDHRATSGHQQSLQKRFGDKIKEIQQYFDILLKHSDLIEENNIETIADVLLRMPKKGEIIEELINVVIQAYLEFTREELIFLLKILRILIEKETRKINSPPVTWEVAQRRIVQLQSLYLEKGMKDLIFKIAYRTNDERVLCETIELALAYLFGGNKDAQNEFYEQFASEPDNRFLLKMNRILEEKFRAFMDSESNRIHSLYHVALKERMEYQSQSDHQDKHEALTEMFKHIQMKKFPEELIVPAESDVSNRLLFLMLHLLKALCENQHTVLQNYLREQKTSSDNHSTSYKSINFLSLLTGFLNSYSSIHSAYNLKLGLEIIDAITEMIQGDVDQNIETVVQRSLYLDITRLLIDYNSPLHLLPRGYCPHPYRKSRDEISKNLRDQQAKKKTKKNEKSIEDLDLDPDSVHFMVLKSHCIKLLVSIAQYPADFSIQSLDQYLDKARLFAEMKNMLYAFFEFDTEKLPSGVQAQEMLKEKYLELYNEDYQAVLGDAINIYTIFRYLWTDNDEWELNIRELIVGCSKDKVEQDLLDAFVFTLMPKLTSSVEVIINRENRDLIRYWYPVLPKCHFLPDKVKDRFLDEVDRSTHESKIQGLLDRSVDFISEMDHEYNIHVLKQGMSTQGLFVFSLWLSSLVAIVINLMYLYFLDGEESQLWDGIWNNITSLSLESLSFKNREGLINLMLVAAFVLVTLNFLFAVINVILWIATQWRREQLFAWRKYSEAYQLKVGDFPHAIQKKLAPELINTLTPAELKNILLYKGIDSIEFKMIRNDKTLYKQIRWLYWRKSIQFIINAELVWLLTYAVISFLAYFFPVCSALLLADIAVRSDTLKKLSQAVLENIKQFLWTLFLLAFVALIYTYIGMYYLYDRMKSDDTDLCADAYHCFMYVLNFGLRNGGGIGDAIESATYSDEERFSYALNLLYNLTFFMIVCAILLNLIFGLIIDAFGELRDQKSDAEEDQQDECFICGIQRREKQNFSFDEHRQKDHNLWSYVYFITYLKAEYARDKNEMNDIEHYVYRQIQSKEFNWIPEGRSLTYEQFLEKNKKNKVELEEEMRTTVVTASEELSLFENTMDSIFEDINSTEVVY